MHLTTITIDRSDHARYRPTGPTHCGTAAYLEHGYLRVRWRILVRCTPELDRRGFLFDQAGLTQFVQRLLDAHAEYSCERLTECIGEAVYQQLCHDVPACHVLSFAVTLSPYPYKTEMTVEWAR